MRLLRFARNDIGERLQAKIYSFNQARGGRFYEQKRVEVIYTTREDSIITVTVYVFYGKWEK